MRSIIQLTEIRVSKSGKEVRRTYLFTSSRMCMAHQNLTKMGHSRSLTWERRVILK